MADGREFRWEIDAYSRETMPLDRLAEYLRELASMLGEPKHLHLIRVESASTVPVLRVDDESAQRVHERAAAIRTGIAPRDAMQSYRKINKMLHEDGGTAALYEDSAEIVPFPGHAEKQEISGIRQQGTLDGELIKVGGPREWVPVMLQLSDATTVTGCYANREIASKLGHYMFQPIRLFGRGRWSRSEEGEWRLDRFVIDTFEQLSDEPLPTVVAALHSVKANWRDDSVALLRNLREDGDGEED